MADHLQHGAAHAQGIDRTDAQQHEAHVANRTAGDAPFDVVLGEGVKRAVDDVDDAQHYQGGSQQEMDFRQHLHVETHQRIAPHLQQHAGQQHRHRCIGLAVGIGQPSMQGENRQLDAETDQEPQVAEQAEGASWRAGRQF